MIAASMADPPDRPRWGEGAVLLAVTPGILAAAVLGLGLAPDRVGWEPNFGPWTAVLAWVAVSFPALVMLGTLSLIVGALGVRHVPGRPPRDSCLGGSRVLAIGAWAHRLTLRRWRRRRMSVGQTAHESAERAALPVAG